MSAASLEKARATRARNAASARRRALKSAIAWRAAMREEARAREAYKQADEPRARERARRLWLHKRAEWAKIPTPRDDVLREVREAERNR